MIYVDIPPEEKYLIIREMTRRDNNLLSITVLCDIAGVSRSGQRTERILSSFWQHTSIGVIPKAHEESTCSCCTRNLLWS